MLPEGMSRRGFIRATVGSTVIGLSARRVRALQANPVKIGILTDMNGVYSDTCGPGSVLAGKMALHDFGPSVLGAHIQLIGGDTGNKADQASNIARQWYDSGVELIAGLPVTPVATAVQFLAKEKSKSVIIAGAVSTEFTSATCSPVSSHWVDDTHCMNVATTQTTLKQTRDPWYFITVDYTFGHRMEDEATKIVKAAGVEVVGSSYFPLNNADFASQILSAQGSKAKIIGLIAVGADLVNLVKQADLFNLRKGRRLAGFVVFISDLHALTPSAAQGLTFASGFQWNQNDKTRAFARRFFAERKVMPTRTHAAVYLGVLHYLKAMQAAGGRDAIAIGRAMRDMPVDYFGRPARLRSDGRLLYDVAVYRTKAPDEVKEPWDYCTAIGSLPPDEAFLPVSAACRA